MYNLLIIIFTFFFTTILILKYKNFISKEYNLLDYPNDRKTHKKPTSLIGGLIGFILLLEFFIMTFFLKIPNKIEYFIIPGLIFIIGLFDDIKDLKPNLKLFLMGSTLLVCIFFFPQFIIKEIRFNSFELSIFTGFLSIFFTIICLLLLINALNMIDGMNGLYLGVNIIFFLYLLNLYGTENFFILSFLIILIILFFCNLKGIFFIGDSGVYLISTILGLLIIENYNYNLGYNDNFVNVEEIFILLMVPGLDMLRLFIIRIKNKKNPFEADRKHFHHLLNKKFNENHSLIIYLLFVLAGPILYNFNIINSILIILIISIIFYSLIYYLNKFQNNN
jgi:UDP-GlcNAc:undecaprenyl-phosphate GlcNAc-1-phosphate transferase